MTDRATLDDAAVAALRQQVDAEKEEKRRLAKRREQKRYYLKNRDRKLEASRKRYETHKEATYLCECCNKLQHCLTRAAHERTAKYREWLKNTQISASKTEYDTPSPCTPEPQILTESECQ